MDYPLGPTFEEMPRLDLQSKYQDGPTSAHFVEEMHTPNILAFTTFTTGSSALPNPVGVTHEELPTRQEAARRVLEFCGVPEEARLIVCYPPLVSLFTPEVLREWRLSPEFLRRPNRDQLLEALLQPEPLWLVGESSFLRVTLATVSKLGLNDRLPRQLALLAAGTPLDPDLSAEAEAIGARLHDLYGCQEFGWLAVDGIPVRDDLTLVPVSPDKKARLTLLVGGLPAGDSFLRGRHPLNKEGIIVSPSCQRLNGLWETRILAANARDRLTLYWLVRSILRLKAKLVRVDPRVALEHSVTELVVTNGEPGVEYILKGPEQTRLFDELLAAQIRYQSRGKYSQSWKANDL